MRLILMRHAEAEERDPTHYPDDAARPLTHHGRELHHRLSHVLARLDLGVQLVLSSPMARARDTAEITAQEIGYAGPIETPAELGPQFSVTALAEVLRHYPSDMTILAVGHQPDLGQFAATMLDGAGAVQIAFPKSAALCLEFEAHPARGRGVLLFHLPPEALL